MLTGVLATTKAPVSTIHIVNVFPHDQKAFTQGLTYHQGYLYESTGLQDKSFLKKIDLQSGKTIKKVKIKAEYFGEGLAILKNKIYQLTWKNHTCLVYDLQKMRLTGKLFYQGEGWGLTTNGKVLFMSNGSSVISCVDPASFNVISRLEVRDGEMKINNLNELEFIRGEIWANIFMEDIIVRISSQTGRVTGWIDLSKLNSQFSRWQGRDVLNGIAYDKAKDRVFVTGKFWPEIYEIKVKPRKSINPN